LLDRIDQEIPLFFADRREIAAYSVSEHERILLSAF
jgi:hypothetical protein